MKTSAILIVILLTALPTSSQVFTNNCIGYVNHSYPAGDSLIGNPLSAANNTLSVLFPAGIAIPNGTTITLWNPVTQNFLAPSIYSQAGGWTLNYSLPPGLGALLHAPSPFLNTFVGELVGGCEPPFIPPTPPPPGYYLLASRTPFPSATFIQTIGRGPLEGESVTRLDNSTGAYFTTTFHEGAWDHGEPAVPIAEAAFFNLVPVPEPAIFSLGVAGVALLLITRRLSRASRRRPE